MAVCRYILAVNRKYTKDGEQEADFIRCVCFGNTAEFAKKYLTKGLKIAVVGRIQTGKYAKDDGSTVFTTDVIIEEHYFCGRNNNSNNSGQESGIVEKTNTPPTTQDEEFIYVGDDQLPF